MSKKKDCRHITLSCGRCGRKEVTAVVREIEKDFVVLSLICSDEQCVKEQREIITAVEEAEERNVPEDFVPVLKNIVLSDEEAADILGETADESGYN